MTDERREQIERAAHEFSLDAYRIVVALENGRYEEAVRRADILAPNLHALRAANEAMGN